MVFGLIQRGAALAALAGALLATTAGQAEEAPLALEGKCPVCRIEHDKWVDGSPEFAMVFDGREYRFPSAEVRDMFAAAPEKYAPALQGDCIVCFAEKGERVPGDVQFASQYRGRLYLFPSDDVRQMFVDDPRKFARADIALDGDCAVCLAMHDHRVPGKLKHVAIHDGMRYLFPSPKERAAFLEKPAEYVEMLSDQLKTSAATDNAVTFSGRIGCAACEYGVHPLGAPDELGLAVTTDEGVFVIEGAHDRWPDLYEARFDHAVVTVTGRVVKSQGRFRWVEPIDLQAL